MTTLALTQSRSFTWPLPSFGRLRLAARWRLRNSRRARLARALAFDRWMSNHVSATALTLSR
jgi:hypothetical protein